MNIFYPISGPFKTFSVSTLVSRTSVTQFPPPLTPTFCHLKHAADYQPNYNVASTNTTLPSASSRLLPPPDRHPSSSRLREFFQISSQKQNGFRFSANSAMGTDKPKPINISLMRVTRLVDCLGKRLKADTLTTHCWH